jgi:hypothetical protein
MLTPLTRFDPVAPLPPRTLANILATGVGQADSPRLAACAAIGVAGGVAILAGMPGYWLASTPFLVMAAFGIWGLATQRLFLIEAYHQRRPVLRTALRAARASAATVGWLAAFVGVARVVSVLMNPVALR